MSHTTSRSSSYPKIASALNPTFPCAPSHVISENKHLILGLSSYPNTLGHTVGTLKPSQTYLFSLNQTTFVEIMLTVRVVAAALCNFYNVYRCAFVADGGPLLSILPLHGLSNDWTPITSDTKEFHEHFPGYISSKDAPEMEKRRLDAICSTIQAASGISEPFNYQFNGDASDKNLFTRIVRGELAQWRIWEDEGHVAFLTPFGNTPGFTVLVPRAHLSSDIFSLDDESYSALVSAAYKVADVLKCAFATDRCGMIFEGFEIDYTHAKLIPIHKAPMHSGDTDVDSAMCEPRFDNKYPGYVTSLNGPKFGDFGRLSSDALSLRDSLLHENVGS